MLTPSTQRVYALPVAAKSAAGIGVPKVRAQQRSPEALFLRPQFLAGVMGAPSGAPDLVPGNANLVASATLLIGVNGGGSLNQYEDTTMSALPEAAIAALDRMDDIANAWELLGDLLNPERDLHTVDRDRFACVVSFLTHEYDSARKAFTQACQEVHS